MGKEGLPIDDEPLVDDESPTTVEEGSLPIEDVEGVEESRCGTKRTRVEAGDEGESTG